MMKRHTAILTMLLAGVMVVLAGCQEPLDFKVKKGESIRVRVSSRNGVSTKVAYSGQTYTENGTTYERINWQVNDQIRLFSTDVSEVATSDGKAYFDYTISAVGTNDPADRYSNATLSFPENHERYGLIWVNEPSATVTVYGIYPPMDEKGEEQEAVTNGGKLTGFVGLNIPAPDLSWSNGVGTPTDNYMKHAYMVSAPTKFSTTSNDPNWNGKPYVDLDFYPIFNAFYVELKGSSTSGEFPVNWVSLSNEVESGTNPYAALTGDYRFNYKERNGDNIQFDANGPIAASITQTGNKGHTVKVNLPANTTISKDKSVKFTILTLPPTSNEKLTNLVLTVNYGTGDGQTKKLRLNDNASSTSFGTPIEFPAFHKARILGLALEGNQWQLTVDGHVLPWDYDEKKTTFTENVQAKAFYVDGSLETLSDYMNSQATIDLYGKTTSNHYEAYDTGTNTDFKTYPEWVALGSGQTAYNSAHKSYYQLYYQLRTLNMNVQPPKKPHFEVTFTPMAPLGGYWTLSTADAPSFGITSQGGAEGFRIVLFDGESELDNWSSGQIMNQEVTLRIYPSDSRDPSKEYCMLLKASFSPNKNGEPSYSADSELQDVHGDGRYSYWKFVIPATE